MKLSELFETDEMVIGFLIGLGFIFIIGFWAILLGLLTGILFRMGGMGVLETKAWRRFGIPIVILVALSMAHGFSWWYSIPFALSVFILSVGYGTPS